MERRKRIVKNTLTRREEKLPNIITILVKISIVPAVIANDLLKKNLSIVQSRAW